MRHRALASIRRRQSLDERSRHRGAARRESGCTLRCGSGERDMFSYRVHARARQLRPQGRRPAGDWLCVRWAQTGAQRVAAAALGYQWARATLRGFRGAEAHRSGRDGLGAPRSGGVDQRPPRTAAARVKALIVALSQSPSRTFSLSLSLSLHVRTQDVPSFHRSDLSRRHWPELCPFGRASRPRRTRSALAARDPPQRASLALRGPAAAAAPARTRLSCNLRSMSHGGAALVTSLPGGSTRGRLWRHSCNSGVPSAIRTSSFLFPEWTLFATMRIFITS